MDVFVCSNVNAICEEGAHPTLIGIFASIGQSLLWWPLVCEPFGIKHEKAPQLYKDMAEKDASFCEVHNSVFYLGGVHFKISSGW